MYRTQLLQEIRRRVERGQPVLLTGESGIGKTWVLEQLSVELPDAIFISHITNKKAILLELAQRMWQDNCFQEYTYFVDWKDVEKRLARLKIPELCQLVHPHLTGYTILFDNLQLCTEKTLLDIVVPLLAANVCATGRTSSKTEQNRMRLIADKFYKVQVPPLEDPEAEMMLWTLIERDQVQHPDTIQDRVLAAAGGKPGVIADMAAQLRGTNGTLPELRTLEHSQQNETHINLLIPASLILLTLLFAGRYAARAFDDGTWTILAAILYSTSYILRPILYRVFNS